MRVKYQDSLEYKAVNRLKKIRGAVVLRQDFEDLGSYRQISRVFSRLVKAKKLVKIGAGVYAKACVSKYTGRPLIKNGADFTLREALKRLNVAFEPGSVEQAYNAGKTTQVPVANIVRLKSRCRRRLGYGNITLTFEKNINAK